jgi:UDP-N-acetylmuramoylalanine-D-glutamate ligase
VPQDARVVEAARGRGIEVTGELELAWRLIPNAFCAVTGTNGKTTTSELIAHLHRTAGRPVVVAGNVGTPLASLVGAVDPDATVVCEASSFQLEDTSFFGPECAVFINLAPDHLDRQARSRTISPRSCGSSPTRATTTSPSTTGTRRNCGDATWAAALASSASARRRRGG